MGTKAYFSNRVYKNTLSKDYVKATDHALLVFNRAKQFAFNTSIKEKRSGKSKRSKSMHLTVKSRFNLDDYYANSAVQEALAIQSSLTELNKMYISNKETQIESVKNKIKKEKSHMTTLMKAKASFVSGKPSFAKNSNMKKVGNLFWVSYKRKTDLYYHSYQFEHEYLDKEIKRIRTKIGFLTFKKNKFENQLKDMKTNVSSVTFGSKKLFKSQNTVNTFKNDHLLWLKNWEQSRYNQMT
jgi:hypothetical protein